jgi:hypothetical protein
MPQAGVSSRARRRNAAPWWEELDHEAFRFPTAYEVKPARRASPRAADAPDRPAVIAPVAAPASALPAGPAPAPIDHPRAPADHPRAPIDHPRAPEGARRTVRIQGRGAERNLPVQRPTLRRHERPGFQPDRAALWAVMLGVLLILVAAASAHAAVIH